MEDEAPVPDPREMVRRMLELDPEELEEFVRLLERERQDATVTLGAPATLDTGGVAARTHSGTATNAGHAVFSVTATGTGYAPSAGTSPAVSAFWDDVKPSNPEQMVAYLNVLLPWVRLLLFLLAGVGTVALTAQQVEDVLRDVLRPGASSEADAPGQPPASVPPATP